ncbi:MAG: cell envelope integrity protein TolA [Thermodesulfobacteriota bacterium]
MPTLPHPSANQEPLGFHPYLQERPRGIPFALAIGVHLLVFLIAFFSPYLFQQRRKIPEVYTVNLFNVQDIGAARLTMPQQTRVTAAAPETKKAEEKAPPKVEVPAPPPPPAAAPPKAISTQPLPAKSKADLDRLKKLKESLSSEQKAKEAEKVAQERAREAVDALRKSLQTQSAKAVAGGATATGTTQKAGADAVAGGPSGSVQVDEVLKRYLIAVNSRVQEHWKLPESQPWKNTLEAIIVIRVRRDGQVVDTFFEHRSENITFNQYVERAIREASPLPPFPAGFEQKDMEIGLRFRPGRVF